MCMILNCLVLLKFRRVLRINSFIITKKGKQKSPGRAKSRSRGPPLTPGGRKNDTDFFLLLLLKLYHCKLEPGNN